MIKYIKFISKGLIKIYSASIYTLGCRVNQYESSAIAEKLTENNIKIKDFSLPCDLYIINTCTVTGESSRKSRQMIRRAKKTNPDALIFVTGCFSQISPQEVASLGCVDYICGTKDKLKLCEMALKLLNQSTRPNTPIIEVGDLDSSEYEDYTVAEQDKTRAYIKIEDGCNGKCSYCIIPIARGPVRSKKIDTVVDEVKSLVSKGCKEIVLTGIEISAYQYDLKTLLSELNKIEGLRRIGMGSIEPSLLKPEFVDTISQLEKIVPHFHLSIQSGSSRILALMRRKYNAETAYRNIEYIKSKIPDVNFTSDIIVGFPGETEDDFLLTKNFIEKVRFLHVHIFTYSKRPGTEAANMPNQVDEKVKIQRAETLNNTQKKIKSELLCGAAENKKPLSVLFEKYENGIAIGHSDNYFEVETESDVDLSDKIVDVIPYKVKGERLKCKII